MRVKKCSVLTAKKKHSCYKFRFYAGIFRQWEKRERGGGGRTISVKVRSLVDENKLHILVHFQYIKTEKSQTTQPLSKAVLPSILR